MTPTRPKLTSFRVTSFKSENSAAAVEGATWKLQVNNQIRVGLAVPKSGDMLLRALVSIIVQADGVCEQDSELSATFSGDYLGQLEYPAGAVMDKIAELLKQEEYAYGLVSQVFPLAMSHFKRELLSTGFDGSKLPLGM